jgi:hypothetical protein
MANYSEFESAISRGQDNAASNHEDQLESAGQAILKLLHKAAGTAEANSREALAMPPGDIPAEVKSCKAISDDKDRLKCFDGLSGGPSKPPKPPDEQQAQKPPEEKQANWSIDETQSPDGKPEVVAANLVNDTVLILRCKNQITEAAFSTSHSVRGEGGRRVGGTRLKSPLFTLKPIGQLQLMFGGARACSLDPCESSNAGENRERVRKVARSIFRTGLRIRQGAQLLFKILQATTSPIWSGVGGCGWRGTQWRLAR